MPVTSGWELLRPVRALVGHCVGKTPRIPLPGAQMTLQGPGKDLNSKSRSF